MAKKTPPAKAAAQTADGPAFDVRVCEGRLCTAHGADQLKATAEAWLDERDDQQRCRLARGGCFGLCELAPNMVVRRFRSTEALPPEDQDRLTLTRKKNEVAYSTLTAEQAIEVLARHLDHDERVEAYTRARREAERPAESPVAARLRALRAKLDRRKRTS